MAVHYFHCTDGVDMVLDHNGHRMSSPDQILAHAHAVAARLMRALPGYDDWRNWTVHVYDEMGTVAIVDFPVVRRRAAA
jgi:hypothetical protein